MEECTGMMQLVPKQTELGAIQNTLLYIVLYKPLKDVRKQYTDLLLYVSS